MIGLDYEKLAKEIAKAMRPVVADLALYLAGSKLHEEIRNHYRAQPELPEEIRDIVSEYLELENIGLKMRLTGDYSQAENPKGRYYRLEESIDWQEGELEKSALNRRWREDARTIWNRYSVSPPQSWKSVKPSDKKEIRVES